MTGASVALRHPRSLVIVLGMLVALGPFTIDLYLPAFPAIQHDFDTTPAAITLTLTGATLGFGIGQLIVGPLSDSVGRRVPLIVSIALHIVASAGAASALSVESLTAFRVAQGMGVTATGVVVIAIARDLFSGQRLVQTLANVAVISGIAPIAAPVFGSQLLRITDWRGTFLVICGYAVVAFVLVMLLVPETLRPEFRSRLRLPVVLGRYRALGRDPGFAGIAVVGALTWSALFSYLAASSFLFQNVYALDAQQYGLIFAGNAVVGLAAGQNTSRVLIPRFGAERVLTAAMVGLLGAAGAVALSAIAAAGGLLAFIAALMAVVVCCACAMPCLQILGLQHQAAQAGTAASVLGGANFCVAGLVTPLVGVLGVTTALPLAAIIGSSAVLALMTRLVFRRISHLAVVRAGTPGAHRAFE
ncbi:multidrug effflux MFS transporter [Subtercola frigoramans]|uniref:DHA1 family bicyclomycin/chloramphenicol resistance-like MFS transporter n=1 Tax=Subtercola frigoramans TaxID=120298 RepID=A0ABS2L0K6_9MICO|nr:multidrug effflux MFS transporter [Subtercola frigoramans]MBM7470466.1 DHA1 family bicyclomycin/chloramphenicol resistance-like MFS transporter [Subtercola frigoramans]